MTTSVSDELVHELIRFEKWTFENRIRQQEREKFIDEHVWYERVDPPAWMRNQATFDAAVVAEYFRMEAPPPIVFIAAVPKDEVRRRFEDGEELYCSPNPVWGSTDGTTIRLNIAIRSTADLRNTVAHEVMHVAHRIAGDGERYTRDELEAECHRFGDSVGACEHFDQQRLYEIAQQLSGAA